MILIGLKSLNSHQDYDGDLRKQERPSNCPVLFCLPSWSLWAPSNLPLLVSTKVPSTMQKHLWNLEQLTGDFKHGNNSFDMTDGIVNVRMSPSYSHTIINQITSLLQHWLIPSNPPVACQESTANTKSLYIDLQNMFSIPRSADNE